MNKIFTATLIAGSILLAGCSKSDSESSSASDIQTSDIVDQAKEQAADLQDSTLHSGTFSGRNDHIVTGAVSVVQAGDHKFIVLGPDFSLDGAPDPKIGFGSDENYDPDTSFTPLENTTGAQRYEIPSNIDLSKYNEVYIWCDKFSVALGVAPIK